MSLELSAAPPLSPAPPSPLHRAPPVELTTPATRDYQQVVAWQAAMDLVAASYRLTRRLPVSERAGLCAAVHAATTVVAARIAAAVGPPSYPAEAQHAGDQRRAIADATSALHESETLLTLLVRLGYVSLEDVAPAMSLAERVGTELQRGAAALRTAAPRLGLTPSRTAG